MSHMGAIQVLCTDPLMATDVIVLNIVQIKDNNTLPAGVYLPLFRFLTATFVQINVNITLLAAVCLFLFLPSIK